MGWPYSHYIKYIILYGILRAVVFERLYHFLLSQEIITIILYDKL